VEALEMDRATQEAHPDWEELQCHTCKVKAQGTVSQLKKWVMDHELKFNHEVVHK